MCFVTQGHVVIVFISVSALHSFLQVTILTRRFKNLAQKLVSKKHTSFNREIYHVRNTNNSVTD